MQTFDFESAAYANFATPAGTIHEANTLQIKESTVVSILLDNGAILAVKQSAAYANLATPAAFILNSLLKAFRIPIICRLFVAYSDWPF